MKKALVAIGMLVRHRRFLRRLCLVERSPEETRAHWYLNRKVLDPPVESEVLAKSSVHGNRFRVTAHPDGSLTEYLTQNPDETWGGTWSWNLGMLHIDVGEYRLRLVGHRSGYWTGIEDGPYGETYFHVRPDVCPPPRGHRPPSLSRREEVTLVSLLVGVLVLLVCAVVLVACIAALLYVSGYPVSISGAATALATALVVLTVGGVLYVAGDAVDVLIDRRGRSQREIGRAAVGLTGLVLVSGTVALVTRHWAAVIFLVLLGIAVVLPVFGYRLGPSEEPADWI